MEHIVLQSLLRSEAKQEKVLSFLGQEWFNSSLRPVLVDKLVALHLSLLLRPLTLYLCVAILDALMSKRRAAEGEVELIAVAAMWIAAKMEEVRTLQVAELCQSSNCSAEDLRRGEQLILHVLDFKVNIPTALHFLDVLLNATRPEGGGEPDRSACLARYILELSLATPTSARFEKSLLAASAMMLTSTLEGKTMQVVSGFARFSAVQLQGCVHELRNHLLSPWSTCKAVQLKYERRDLGRASLYAALLLRQALPNSSFSTVLGPPGVRQQSGRQDPTAAPRCSLEARASSSAEQAQVHKKLLPILSLQAKADPAPVGAGRCLQASAKEMRAFEISDIPASKDEVEDSRDASSPTAEQGTLCSWTSCACKALGLVREALGGLCPRRNNGYHALEQLPFGP